MARSGDIQYGLGAAVGQVSHTADFNNLPDVPKANAPFGDTTEVHFSLHAFAELPLGTPFHAGLRLEYFQYSPQFLAFEPTVILSNDAPLNTAFRHELNTSLDAIALEPYLAWREPYWPWLTVGAQFAVFPSASYSQDQFLPPGTDLIYDFPQKNGDLESINLQTAIHIAAGYDVPIGGADAVIRPSIDLLFGLNNLVEETEWKTWSIRGGIAIAFGARPDKYVRRDTVIQRDTSMSLTFGIQQERMTLRERKIEETAVEGETERYILTKIREEWLQEIPAPQPLLTGSVAAKFIDENGRESETLTLDLQRTRVERLIQVPALYSVLPRSKRGQILRQIDPLYELYHSLPRLIGEQGKNVNSLFIEYYGQSEKGPSALAMANTVESMALDTENTGLTVNKVAGKGQLDSKFAHLKLAVDFAEGQHFLRSTDTIATGPTPVVRFTPDVISEAGISDWLLRMRYNGIVVDSLSGKGAPPKRLDVPINFAYDLSVLIEQSTTYEFEVRDSTGGSEIIGSGTLRFREGESSSPLVQSRQELALFAVGMAGTDPGLDQAINFLTAGKNAENAQFAIVTFPRRSEAVPVIFEKNELKTTLLNYSALHSDQPLHHGILIIALPN